MLRQQPAGQQPVPQAAAYAADPFLHDTLTRASAAAGSEALLEEMYRQALYDGPQANRQQAPGSAKKCAGPAAGKAIASLGGPAAAASSAFQQGPAGDGDDVALIPGGAISSSMLSDGDGDGNTMVVEGLDGPADAAAVGSLAAPHTLGGAGPQQPVQGVQATILVISAPPLNTSEPSSSSSSSGDSPLGPDSSAASLGGAGAQQAAGLEQSIQGVIGQMDASLQSLVAQAFGLLGVQLEQMAGTGPPSIPASSPGEPAEAQAAKESSMAAAVDGGGM
jgi:hypothetical protein